MFGTAFANFFSHRDDEGTWRILGETIAHTGYIIMILQVFVSRFAEKFKAMPTFMFGMVISAAGFVVLGGAVVSSAWLVFAGIALFAVGEMVASPRIQEYVTWMAPKEKAGLYMGANFLALGVGAFSGVTYTPLYGRFEEMGHPEYVWYVLAVHLVVGMAVLTVFTRVAGEFTELGE